MGDRGNIVIQDSSGRRVYLYTHWRGSDIPELAKEALRKRWRWDDPAYLARIVFDVMTEGQHDQEAGFGISAKIEDNENPILVIDCGNAEVFYEDGNGVRQGAPVSFEDFIK